MCRTHPTPVLEGRKRDKTLKPIISTQSPKHCCTPKLGASVPRDTLVMHVCHVLHQSPRLFVLACTPGREVSVRSDTNDVHVCQELLQKQGMVELVGTPRLLVACPVTAMSCTSAECCIKVPAFLYLLVHSVLLQNPGLIEIACTPGPGGKRAKRHHCRARLASSASNVPACLNLLVRPGLGQACPAPPM